MIPDEEMVELIEDLCTYLKYADPDEALEDYMWSPEWTA